MVGAAFGWLTDVLAIRRVLARSDEHLWLLSTLALATMVQQAVGLWWGTEPKPFPRLIPQDFSAGIADQKFWLPIGMAIVMALGLELFYRRTMYGKLFLAMSEDAFAARARGVPTDRIRSLSYVIAGAHGRAGRLRRRATDLRLLRAGPDAHAQRLHRARRRRPGQQRRAR